jgi:hypothetical protein
MFDTGVASSVSGFFGTDREDGMRCIPLWNPRIAVHGISWVIGVRAQLRSHNVEDTSLGSNANNANNGSNGSWRKGVGVQLRLRAKARVQPNHGPQLT